MFKYTRARSNLIYKLNYAVNYGKRGTQKDKKFQTKINKCFDWEMSLKLITVTNKTSEF